MVAVLADTPAHAPRPDHRRARPDLRLVPPEQRFAAPAPTSVPALRRQAAGSTAHLAARSRPVGAATHRRRRIVVVGTLLAAVLGAGIALQAALGGAGGGPLTVAGASSAAVRAPAGSIRPVAAHTWVVRPGDDLWSIALAVHAHGDIRPFVDQLSAETHGQPLAVGQRLTLP